MLIDPLFLRDFEKSLIGPKSTVPSLSFEATAFEIITSNSEGQGEGGRRGPLHTSLLPFKINSLCLASRC